MEESNSIFIKRIFFIYIFIRIMKTFLEDKKVIKSFLDKHATVYDLKDCVGDKGLFLNNNIEYGGRVPNFIIDKYDIKYFTEVLDNLNLLGETPRNITTDYLQSNIIELIIQWIQLRLNTGIIFKFSYWDYLNNLYVNECFKNGSFKSLATKGMSNTNIRNLYFGDCREHEVLLHVMLKIYLQHHGLDNEFMVFKYYGYGTTITNSSLNTKFWKDKKFELNMHLKSQMGGSKSASSKNSSNSQSSSFMKKTLFPSIDKIEIATWEHTHPLLYVKSENKIYALDALGHKTGLNPNMVERHNIEIKIEALPVQNRIDEYNYSLWYNNLQDKDSRIYVENPTPFSKNTPFIMPVKKNVQGLIFGNKFNREKLESSQYYKPLLRVLDLRSLNRSAILSEGINELCLIKQKDSSSSMRTSPQTGKKFTSK